MLVIENQKHYDETIAFAKRVGLYEGEGNHVLANRLKYLKEYGGTSEDRVRVRLLKDCAPHSFYLLIERKDGDAWKPLFNGGLLFHGPHDGNGNGAGPTFAVTLEPTVGWSIHT